MKIDLFFVRYHVISCTTFDFFRTFVRFSLNFHSIFGAFFAVFGAFFAVFTRFFAVFGAFFAVFLHFFIVFKDILTKNGIF